MADIAKIQTLHDNTTGEAVAPRTVVEALSGTGTEGQIVGYTEDNVVGPITPDAVPTEGSTNPVQSGGVYEATKWHTNKNLLDNWYFVGGGSQNGNGTFPINQRGQTEWFAASQGIDRWWMQPWNAGEPHFELTAEGITQYGEADCVQRIEFVRIISGRRYTLSFITSDMKLYSQTSAFPDDNTLKLYPFGDGDGKFVFAKTASMYYIAINTQPKGTPLTIVAIKLELGDKQTLAHKEGDTWVLNEMPDYCTELLRCQRYYQTFSSADKCPVEAEDFRPVMRTKPALRTIQVGDKTYYTADANL